MVGKVSCKGERAGYVRHMLRGVAVAALVLTGGCAATGQVASDPQWQRVFDGRSLAGWTPKIVGEPAGLDARRTFIVKDGAIRVSYAGYDKFGMRFGHLFYDKPVRFFRLRLRYRFLDPALPDTPEWARSNSGVMFLAQPPQEMALAQPFPVSIEAQFRGRDGDGPRVTGSICTPGTEVEIGGKVSPLHCIDSRGPTLANGQWVRFELDVLPSGEIIHRIDGQEVHRYARATLDPKDPTAQAPIARQGGKLALTEGYFALQSEGHPIEFADIEIQRLGE